jgi:hypothetical protein
MSIIAEGALARIRDRVTFPIGTFPWVFAYRTVGGTYMIASDGKQSDSERPRDILAVAWNDEALLLSPLTSPEVLQELLDALLEGAGQ